MIESVSELIGWIKLQSIPVSKVRVGDIVHQDGCFPFRVARIERTDGEYLRKPCTIVYLYDDLGNGSGLPLHLPASIIPRRLVEPEPVGR